MAQHAGAPGRLGGCTRLFQGAVAKAHATFRTPGHTGNADGCGWASCPWAETQRVEPPGHTGNKRYAIALDFARGKRELRRGIGRVSFPPPLALYGGGSDGPGGARRKLLH